jgi:hypothetical protein
MKVYGVYRQEDMTEGRGRMILHKVYRTKERAEEFANNQTGIMGRKPRTKWTDEAFGDWQVKEIEVID